MDDKPIWSAPSPNFWRHTSCQAGRTARQRSCVQIYNLREPGSIDPACLDVYTSHLHPENCPNGYIQRLLDNSCSFHSAKKELMCCVAPATPTCLVASVSGDNTDHSRIDVPLASIFYCSPSGLSELLPARRISSVDNRLTAITELRHHVRRGKAFVILNQSQPAE